MSKFLLYPYSLAALSALPLAADEKAPVEVGTPATFSWVDLEGDGRLELAAVSADGVFQLLAAAGENRFEDVSARVGLAGITDAALALWVDYDADGRLDLFVGARAGASRLFRNEGGSFVDMTSGAGLTTEGAVRSADWLDHDGDGRADLHVVTAERHELYRGLAGGFFERTELPLLGAGSVAGPSGVVLDEAAPKTPSAAGSSSSGELGSSAGTPTSRVLDGVGSSGRRAPLGLPPSVGGATPITAFPSGCASSIKDQANPGTCLQASTTPTLGKLYPLSTNLFVAVSGNVGIGTTSPSAKLDVAGDVRASGQLVSTAASGAPLSVSSTSLVANLNADQLDGLDSGAFSQLGFSIEGLEITDGTITAFDVASDTLTSEKLADGSVGSLELVDGAIVNADVSGIAAVAGTKISPDFGAQSIVTTGTLRADGAGIGTSAPPGALHVLSSASSGALRAQNSSSTSDAVVGINTAAAGTSSGSGVYGESNQNGASAGGVRGRNTNANGCGVIGTGNNETSTSLVGGAGGSFHGQSTGVFARSATSGVGQALYANQFGAEVRVAYWNGATFYKINGTGTVSTNVADPTDAERRRRITLHATESPEVYFSDFGSGQLRNGFAHVELDPRFAGSVRIDDQHPLRVFVQLEENEWTRGVVVKNKTATGFDVVEIGGGRSNMPFQWQIVCNRADEVLPGGRLSRNADLRFETAAEPLPLEVEARDSTVVTGGG